MNRAFPLFADARPVRAVLLREFRDALINRYFQVFAALSDDWPTLARDQGWVLGMGGQPDSCWMWRRDGALQASRAAADPPTGR